MEALVIYLYNTLREFVYRHSSSLLTKRGSRQHTCCPKRTKLSNMSLVQHANPGCSKQPFSRAFRIYPTYPPLLGQSAGTNEARKAPTPENALCWHEIRCPRERERERERERDMVLELFAECNTATGKSLTPPVLSRVVQGGPSCWLIHVFCFYVVLCQCRGAALPILAC